MKNPVRKKAVCNTRNDDEYPTTNRPNPRAPNAIGMINDFFTFSAKRLPKNKAKIPPKH